LQKPPYYILPLIILSQFAGTSLWFAGNAILPELKAAFGLNQYAVSLVTSAVMLGFIAGTLVFAFLSLADRYSPSRLFFISSILAALCNASVAWLVHDGSSLFLFRFLTGFFIAGIYPVGMKIAADWYDKGLGKALGFLLGALVVGTAFPHLLKNKGFALPWKNVLYISSLFAFAGGLLMLAFVGDGPYRKRSGGFQFNAFAEIFRSKSWRQAAIGYFGHMWELYAFWGFLPLILNGYMIKNNTSLNVPLLSFLIIASGSISCMAGGYIAQKIGHARTASGALFISGMCCFLSPLFFLFPLPLFLAFLFIWGLTVVPDSPQLSTLVAQYAPPHLKGTALTIYNSIGFSVTTISIIVMDHIYHSKGILGGSNALPVLGLGALAGLPSLYRLVKGAK
jgi:MFS family permease